MNKEKILKHIEQAEKAFNEIHLLVTEKQYLEDHGKLLLQQRNLAAESIGALEPIFEKNIYKEKELAKVKNIFRKSLTISDLFGSNVLLIAVSELKIAHSKIKNHLSDKPSSISKNNSTDFPPSSVFIVHGHDELAKTEIARFIENLGLEAIILHEKVSAGKTIIEKIEEYSNVGFGVVLYTPCDQGCKIDDKKNIRYRARQNVVFEHGYLIGKIGRKNVCALVKGNIEIPNDISGVVYVPFKGEWKLILAKELRNSGYLVNMNLVV